MGWRTVKKRGVEPEPMPAQVIIEEFDGMNYCNLTDEQARIFETLRRFECLEVDDRGDITATERGRGIVDGSIKTNRNVPAYFQEYLSKSRCAAKCGTDGSRI